MRKARQAAAYLERLAVEIQNVIDDPRPKLSHDEVMAKMDADIVALADERKPAKRKGA